MRKAALRIIVLILAAAPLALAAVPAAQKVETVDGVRLVHNVKGGLWGPSPHVALELVRRIGDIDAEDENESFSFPSDVAVDKGGNIYVLDSANARLQKFGPDGAYLATIGRKGQGPGEFIMPGSMAFDQDGNLVVADPAQARVHIIIDGGRDVRSVVVKDEMINGISPLPGGGFVGKASTYSLPGPDQRAQPVDEMRLFRRIGPDGRVSGSFGSLTDFGEAMTSAYGNACEFDLDGTGALVASFNAQNKIEKYAPDGRLLWRADRPLAFGTEVRKKGRTVTAGDRMLSTSAPVMNVCSKDIAVDGKGRAWVVTPTRQLRKEEEVQTTMMMARGRDGGFTTASVKTEDKTGLRTTDAFKLEIFDPDGVLLGEIPLTHFADVIRIAGDSLFLIDRERGVTVYQYRVVEK